MATAAATTPPSATATAATGRADVREAIVRWVQIDNDMREVAKKTAALRKAKREATDALLEVMRSDSIDRVDLSNGYLSYTRTNVRRPITQKSLYAILLEYCERDEARAKEMSEFVLANRETAMRETVVRHVGDA